MGLIYTGSWAKEHVIEEADWEAFLYAKVNWKRDAHRAAPDVMQVGSKLDIPELTVVDIVNCNCRPLSSSSECGRYGEVWMRAAPSDRDRYSLQTVVEVERWKCRYS